MDKFDCDDCRTLAQELRLAYADLLLQMDDRVRDAYIGALEIIEERSEQEEALRAKFRDPDVWEVAFERLPKFQPSIDPDRISPETGLTRLGKVIARMRMHTTRTGHKF